MFIAECISEFSTSYGLPASLFLAGLVGGATHCAGMCAPFVLAQASENPNQTSVLKRLSKAALLPYHLGRMTTYVVLAILLSSVLNLAFISSELRALISAPLLMTAGVLFLISAFPQSAMLFPWAARLRIAQPFSFVSTLVGGLMHNPGVLKRYLLGTLLGFMPCGLVVSAILAAATAPSALSSGAAMAAFALGTMPALIAIGFGGSLLMQAYPGMTAKLSRRVKQSAMVVSSLWLFGLAGAYLF